MKQKTQEEGECGGNPDLKSFLRNKVKREKTPKQKIAIAIGVKLERSDRSDK